MEKGERGGADASEGAARVRLVLRHGLAILVHRHNREAHLAGGAGRAPTASLRALARAEAEARLAATLAAARPAATTLLVRLDPATPTSGETLFLPIGRALLAARQAGRVLRFAPLPESAGAGFHATLPARAA